MDCYRRALEINPKSAEAHNLLGNVLAILGRTGEAISQFKEAMRLQPRNAVAHSNLLMAMNYLPDIDRPALLAEHRFWDRLHGQGLAVTTAYSHSPDPDRRLRIGYVSPDFRRHAVSGFLEPIPQNHDPGQFEVFAYAEVPRPDETTTRFQSMVSHWRRTTGKNDIQLAKQIREDRIDILIDLAGHSAGNRLPVFGHTPAPVQMTYLG